MDVDWYLSGRGADRHNSVCVKLKAWLKKKYPNSFVRCLLKSYRHKGQSISLKPDMDVGMIRDSELVGFEVKLFAARRAGQTEKFIGSPERLVRGIDREIYSGLGQALFLLRYADSSYLVIPEIRKSMDAEEGGQLQYLLEKLLAQYLPIGLIEFCPKGDKLEFQVTHSAKANATLLGFHRNSLIEAIRMGNC